MRWFPQRLHGAFDADHAPIDRLDRTRERIYSLSADDVTEDEVETADAVLDGLAYQYATEQSRQVAILVSDRLAEQAIADVLAAMGVE